MKKIVIAVILIMMGGGFLWVYLTRDPIAHLASYIDQTSYEAFDQLVNQGKPIVPYLLQEYSRRTNSKEKAGIIRVLGKIGDHRSLETILKALNDSDKTIRSNAFSALDDMFCWHREELDKSIIPTLINLLDDNRPLHGDGIKRPLSLHINQGILSYFYLELDIKIKREYLSDSINQIAGLPSDLNGTRFGWSDDSLQAQEKWNKIKNFLNKFWEENKDYIYLSLEDTPERFLIDQDAKTSGIPTEEYRKTHPWPPKPKISGGIPLSQYPEYLKSQENKVREIVKQHYHPLKIDSIGFGQMNGVDIWDADVYLPVDPQKDYRYESVEITDDNGRKVMGQRCYVKVDIDSGKILSEGERGGEFVRGKLLGRKSDTNYSAYKEGENVKCFIISEAVKNPVIWDTFDDKGTYVILPDNKEVRYDDNKCLLILVNLIGEIHTSYIKVSEQEVDQLFRIFREQVKPENYFWKTKQHLGDDRFDEETLKFLSGE